MIDDLASEWKTPDVAIARTERELSLLRTYRTRLIAGVITAKLDVRGAVAALPEVLDQADAFPFLAGQDGVDHLRTGDRLLAPMSRTLGTRAPWMPRRPALYT